MPRTIAIDATEYLGGTSAVPWQRPYDDLSCRGCGSSLVGRREAMRRDTTEGIRFVTEIFRCRCGRGRHPNGGGTSSSVTTTENSYVSAQRSLEPAVVLEPTGGKHRPALAGADLTGSCRGGTTPGITARSSRPVPPIKRSARAQLPQSRNIQNRASRCLRTQPGGVLATGGEHRPALRWFVLGSMSSGISPTG